jgi:hypothetical protein
VPGIVAAVIKRLGVRQSITQTEGEVAIKVSTMVGGNDLLLKLDGTEGLLPDLKGGKTLASSTWLDGDLRLETRQCVDDKGRLDDPDAMFFVTTRSLFDGGSSLLEHCALVRSGVPVEKAMARRILRRVAPAPTWPRAVSR